jgi:hypothetical protein
MTGSFQRAFQGFDGYSNNISSSNPCLRPAAASLENGLGKARERSSASRQPEAEESDRQHDLAMVFLVQYPALPRVDRGKAVLATFQKAAAETFDNAASE